MNEPNLDERPQRDTERAEQIAADRADRHYDQAIDRVAESRVDIAIKRFSENAWDIGLVDGILSGLDLTAELVPTHKLAVAKARQAIKRIGERNFESAKECYQKP